MGWESSLVVGFDLGPLLQGQLRGLGGAVVRVHASNL